MSGERCTATNGRGHPCQAMAMRGSTRCVAHTRSHQPPHLRSRLTPDRVERLEQLLRSGNYINVACLAVGISRDTYHDWINRGRAENPDPAAAPYIDFRERMDRARAEGEARNVAIIAKAATENWQAAAWMLERTMPERWARPSVRAAPDPVAPPEPEVAADPFAEVDELAKRRRG